MEYKREFFPIVKKTIMPRPVYREETDILGQSGIAWATEAIIYGPNWYHDREQGLIEIYDAGPALCFRDILPKKHKYAREGLYLRLALAYRTTENANANIRTFSGNHVNLPNSLKGSIYIDPFTYHWVSDDMTININSIYLNEKLWIQRVEWEWVSKETIFDDEVGKKDINLIRSQKEIEAIYTKKEITSNTVKEYLINRVKHDENFAKRCLALLNSDNLFEKDLVTIYKGLNIRDA
ncbi:hypothetical protein JXL19_12370 [bacterium]|nr:hypothetical protein [bacterium]